MKSTVIYNHNIKAGKPYSRALPEQNSFYECFSVFFQTDSQYLLSSANSFVPLLACMMSLCIESKIIPDLLKEVSIIPILCSSSSLIWPVHVG